MRKSILALLALALVLALGGSAFAAKDSLVVADQYDATTFDPIRHNDYPSSRACHQVYDTLIALFGPRSHETLAAEPSAFRIISRPSPLKPYSKSSSNTMKYTYLC